MDPIEIKIIDDIIEKMRCAHEKRTMIRNGDLIEDDPRRVEIRMINDEVGPLMEKE